jgi:hypothetical protein
MLKSLVRDATAVHPNGRLGRNVPAEVAARADWQPTIPAEPDLDASGRALLETLVDAWAVSAAHPPLFPGQHGTVGFDVRNYGTRFQKATGGALGNEMSPAPSIETGML